MEQFWIVVPESERGSARYYQTEKCAKDFAEQMAQKTGQRHVICKAVSHCKPVKVEWSNKFDPPF